MSASSELKRQLVRRKKGDLGEKGPSEVAQERTGEEVTEAQFDVQVAKVVQIIQAAMEFLNHGGLDLQNLVVCHLEKITTILDVMQRRNHSRSATIVSVLTMFLHTAHEWTCESYVLDFMRDRDMDYFLRHANARRMTVRVNNNRLPDHLLLLMLGHQYCNSRQLKCILRYGVTPPERGHHTIQIYQFPDDVNSQDSIVEQATLHFCNLLKNKKNDDTELLEIGHLLVAALPNIYCCAANFPADVIAILADDFPELIGRAVPSLRQLCRTLVRNKLHANWVLPDGIQLLDLPLQVKAYLDLET